jgi:hypothetical protein
MNDCRLNTNCNANLCPLDSELDKRTWFIGDDVCNLPDYRQLPMIQRQRQLNRLKPNTYLDMALRADWLAETVRAKRILTDEQREMARARMMKARKSLGRTRKSAA